MSMLEQIKAAHGGDLNAAVEAYRSSGVAAPTTLAIIEWAMERLTAPPTDDEREALRLLIHQAMVTTGLGFAVAKLADYEQQTYDAILDRSADTILSAGFRRQGPITDALREWVGGEPYEVSCARAGHPVETTSATDPQLAFIDGYQRAVHHVAAILEAAREES